MPGLGRGIVKLFLRIFIALTCVLSVASQPTSWISGFISCATASASSDSGKATFTLGYVRMAVAAFDSTSVLAGLFATVKYYNDNDLVPGVRFALNVTTIACTTTNSCRSLSVTNRRTLQLFIDNMGKFSAIIKPNPILAATIVDEARRLGGIPVINPDDVRVDAFRESSNNIINFRQSWSSQAEHLFTFMMQNGRCARSAIIYGRIGDALQSEYDDQIERIRALFARGEYPSPPSLEVQTASDDVFYDFFFSDINRRRCFIVLGTASLMQEVMERLILNSTFSLNSFFFYGVSQMMSDSFVSNSSSTLFRNTYFTHWLPPLGESSSHFEEALMGWDRNRSAYDNAAIHRTERYPSTVDNTSLAMLESYIVAVFAMESIRTAISFARHGEYNTSAIVPVPWSRVLSAMYRDARTVDGFLFNKLVRECPSPPAPQVCFCNVLASSSYIFRINTSTGAPYRLFDDYSTGQRDISYVRFPSQCGYSISSWSYPIIALALYPDYLLIDNANSRLDEEKMSYDLFQRVFGIMTRETNYEPTPPTRALRYAAYDVPSDRTQFTTSVNYYIDTLKPFVIYGSLSTSLQGTQDVLTLLPTFLGMTLEDPVLVPHSQWRWTTIQIRPTLADYIHAHIGYYASNDNRFTSARALASTAAEARLISQSFATWGYDVPVSAVIVTGEVDRWGSIVEEVLSDAASFRPFLIVATQNNNNSLIETASMAAGRISRGTLAIACSVAVVYKARLVTNFTLSTGNSDIIFGAFNREWWLPTAYDGVPLELHPYVVEPRYHIALLAIQVSRQLYSQVYFDYKTTAAEVLYRASVISAGGTSLGPFSNASCTARQVSRNDRDRACQCTKGIRTIFVHSMRDYMESNTSTRTSRYSYTMTTCGIVYTEYVPPPTLRSRVLSSGAIAGIAVGGSIFVLFVLAYIVYTAYFSGRDNRAAPKDSSLPFAIAFTDIQSSTSLWARAPSAMSEAIDQHHRLLRKALRSHDGYEVKTVGDSFMVAFRRVEDAISFSLAVQISLFEAEWSSEINATYVELLLEAEVEAVERGSKGGKEADGDETSEAERTINNTALANSNIYTSSHIQNIAGSAVKLTAALADEASKDGGQYPMIAKSIHTSDTESVKSYATSAGAGGPLGYSNFHKDGPTSPKSISQPHLHTFPAVIGHFTATSPKSMSGQHRNAFGVRGTGHTSGGHNAFADSAVFHHQQQRLDQHSSFKNSNAAVGGGRLNSTAESALSTSPQSPTITAPARRNICHPEGIEGSANVAGGRPPASPIAVGSNHPHLLATSFTNGDSIIASNGPASIIAAEEGAAAPYSQHLALSQTDKIPFPPSPVIRLSESVRNDQHNDASVTTPTATFASLGTDRRIWNGLRVRIGVHFGHGDIRKDEITQGYDYYGTVVNTAARVEGVGHGGQILLTHEAHGAVAPTFFHKAKAVTISLGPQPLRGLDEPIRLFQIVPSELSERRFPPLRLHVEKESEDESSITDISGTDMSAETPEALISRLCATKQFSSCVTPAELFDRYAYFMSSFGPTTDKYKTSVVSKLADAWGIPKGGGISGAGDAGGGGGSGRTRQSVALVGRITKAYNAANKRKVKGKGPGGKNGTITADTNTVHTATGTRRGSNSTASTNYTNQYTNKKAFLELPSESDVIRNEMYPRT